MSFFETALADNSIVNAIEQAGNHFIMDSEQVVSNPFEEKQNEALNIMGKRASVTEKLTSAKNNLCENHFTIRRGKLEREVNFKMKQLHDNSSRLRYEVKLFDIHKRKNELVVKKRVEPERDFTYDATQINNSEKRLGVMSDCYYLEKKQGYKLRDKAKKDLDTPMAKKAQEFLRQQKIEEKLKEGRSTPKFNVSKNHVPLWKRRGSKSAPASSKHGSARFENKENFDEKLPTIHIAKRKESHVKFSLNDGIKNHTRTPTPELLSRSLTFFSGMRRRSVWHNGSDDEEDDDEYIDTGKLRTLLYGDQWSECAETSSSPSLRTSTRESARSMSIIRRNQNRPITQEMMQQERKRINNKIKRFFDKIEIESIGSLSDEEEDATANQPPPPKVGIQNQASKMMNVFSKPVEKTNAFQATVTKPKDSEEKKSASTIRTKSVQSNHSGKQKKNLWEYIQVQLDKGNLKRVLTPSELILQQMTGLDLMDSKEKHIPLHAANRALRHTPTFKMRKVVQNLMQNRTKFEQQEVESLRKQIGGPEGEGEGQPQQEGQRQTPIAGAS